MNAPAHPHVQNQPALDIRDKAKGREGDEQVLDTRLYMQLQVFTGCRSVEPLIESLRQLNVPSVLYQDVNDAQGVALLTMSEDENTFVNEVRALLLSDAWSGLTQRPEFTMIGRTYATGREPDLKDWMLEKPRRNVMKPDWPWAVWYPLRRKPEFEVLTPEEQGKILFEHARIGMTYGRAELAHDVRLACHGLDKNDNEFVIGLIGQRLHPLSRCVQDMRKTQQTAKYIQSLGPFFVGKACWQSHQ